MMTEWNGLEFQRELTSGRIDDLLEALKPYSVVMSGGDGYATNGVTFTVDAPTAAAALEETWRVFASLESIAFEDLIEVEVQRQADKERKLRL